MGRSPWIAAVAAIALAASTAAAQAPDSVRRRDTTRAAAGRIDTARATARRDSTATPARRDSAAAAAAGRDSLRLVSARRAAAAAARALPGPRVPGASGNALWWTAGCLVFYFLSIALSRWHHIGRSMHEMIERQVATLEMRLDTEVGAHRNSVEIAALQRRVAAMRSASDRSLKNDYLRTPRGFSEFLFWSRGRENAMWVEIHEVERQLTAYLSPIEQVNVYLVWAAAELCGIRRKGADAITAAIGDALATPLSTFEGERATQERTRKALLGRALAILYGERDSGFAALMEWQNKASWLAFAALLLIGFLAASAGNAVLFLAGAAGGYTSRVMRAINRDGASVDFVPLDYGASWTTLYLSPLYGALAGWFGIALITLVSNDELHLLGDAFQRIRWDEPTVSFTVAIAFLLGFSERFFDAVVGAVEKHAQRAEEMRSSASERATPSIPDVDARRAAAGRADGAQPGGVQAPAGLPYVATTERHGVKTNEPKETLLVRGTGFVPQSKVRVNGRERDVEVRSVTELSLSLTPADLSAIELGDFVIAVVNPGGTATAERHVFETA
jgi:hypothetical protein